MTTIIDGVKCGYTNQGNPYKKSDAGKKAGMAIAVGVPTAAIFVPYKTSLKLYSKILPKGSAILEHMQEFAKMAKTPLQLAKKFVNGSMNDYVFQAVKDVPKEELPKLIRKLQSSKGARAAYVALGLGVCYAIYAGVGRLLGAGVDKIIDKGAKAEADRRAQQEK